MSKFSVSLELEQLRKVVVPAFQRCTWAHAASATSVPYHLRSFKRRKWQVLRWGTDRHARYALSDIEGGAWERPRRLFIIGRVQPDQQRQRSHVRFRADNLEMEYAWVLPPSQRVHLKQGWRGGFI